MQKITDKWKIFLSIIFDPWVFIFMLSTILLFVYKYNISTNAQPTTMVIITLMITLSSAILGSRITKQWIDISEGSLLVARGRSAVRSLKLLLSSIFSLDRRVKYYIHQKKNNNLGKDSLDLIFSEFCERCNILSEETVSSIENWTDIIPEADIKTHIGIISDLKANLENTKKELNQISLEKDEIKGRKDKEKKQLEAQIKTKEREIDDLREELRQKEIRFGINVGTQATTLGSFSPGSIMSNIPGIIKNKNINENSDNNNINDLDEDNNHICE